MNATPGSNNPNSMPGQFATPSGLSAVGGGKHAQAATEEQVVARLRQLMQMNLVNMCYTDAIFFADKLLHLQTGARTDHFIKAVYDLGKYTCLLKHVQRIATR